MTWSHDLLPFLIIMRLGKQTLGQTLRERVLRIYPMRSDGIPGETVTMPLRCEVESPLKHELRLSGLKALENTKGIAVRHLCTFYALLVKCGWCLVMVRRSGNQIIVISALPQNAA